jgi:hypothetical protein
MKVISAVYAIDSNDPRSSRIEFVFSKGKATWFYDGCKFPRPGWPVVPLSNAEFNIPNFEMKGAEIDGERFTMYFSHATDDPVAANLTLKAIDDIHAGTFQNGKQVWPIGK